MQTHHDIPIHLKEGLDRYMAQGVPLGGFLTSVVCNDLIGSFAKADHTSTEYMQAICAYVYNQMPNECNGSSMIYHGWLRCKQLERDGHESEARDQFTALVAAKDKLQRERPA